MPNYQNGKIYKLWSPLGDEIYIGSTTRPLSERLAEHVRRFKGNRSSTTSKILFEKYGTDNVQIELIENHPCNSIDALNKREGYYIRTLDCVNKRIEARTKDEYNIDNQELIKEQKKLYYQNNKEKIEKKNRKYRKENSDKIREYKKQYAVENADKIRAYQKKYAVENADKIRESKKQYCQENADKISEYRKQYALENADKISEYRKQYALENADKISEYKKQYALENADKIKDYHKKFYQENADKIKDYHKQFYQENKQKISEKRKISRYICACGSSCAIQNKAQHLKSDAHKWSMLYNYIESLSTHPLRGGCPNFFLVLFKFF